MIANLAEGWRDRETGVVTDLADNGNDEKKAEIKVTPSGDRDFINGQRVRHSHYGDGVITDVVQLDDDATITVLFDASGPRNFLQSLVADKIEVVG